MKTSIYFWSYLARFLWEWEMFQTKVVEKIKTHIFYSIFFSRKSCRLWDNVGKCCRAGRPHMTVRGMRISICIRKATNTHSEYVIIISALPLQQWLHKHASVLRHSTLPVLFSVLTSLCSNAHLAELLDVKAFLLYLLTKSVFKMTGEHSCEVTSYLILLLVAFANLQHLR
jgi:hypothetical protein